MLRLFPPRALGAALAVVPLVLAAALVLGHVGWLLITHSNPRA